MFLLHQVTIKYSKLGLEDFDFKHYNRTLFAGWSLTSPMLTVTA